MVLMNLMLWGYAMAICQSCFASLTYVMSAMIFMGMMELASALSEPFGEDEVDFPLSMWLDDLLACAEVLLETDYVGIEKGWESVVKSEGKVKISGADFMRRSSKTSEVCEIAVE